MKKLSVMFVAAVALSANAAMADHCDANLADADAAIAGSTNDFAEILDAADAIVEDALDVCEAEEAEMAAADLDSPLLDPDYVTMGQSMLLHAQQLANGE